MAEFSHTEKGGATPDKEDGFDHVRWQKVVKKLARLMHSEALSEKGAAELAKVVEENLDIIEDGLREKDYFQDALLILKTLAKPSLNAPEVSGLAVNALSKNLDFLEDKIEPVRSIVNADVLNTAVLLIHSGTDIQNKQGVDFLTRHFQDIDFNMREGHGIAYVSMIEAIVGYGAPEDRRKALSILNDYLRSEKDYYVIGRCLKSPYQDLRQFAEPMIQEEFDRYGIDSKKFLDAWSVSDSKDFFGFAVSLNLNSIEYLEGQRPGIARFLNAEFGIYDFGRYPADMLIKQYDEYKNTALPYGVVFYPRNDHNGAFYNTNGVFQNLFSKIGEKCALRVAEGDGKIDIVKMLHKLNRKYGQNRKIQFAIIGGHGAPDRIQFGGLGEEHQLKITDLIDERAKKSGYFEKNPTIILNSCETGFMDGIGQKLSEILNADVIAPDSQTNLKEISFEFVDNKAKFNVEYLKPGVARSYSSGQQS